MISEKELINISNNRSAKRNKHLHKINTQDVDQEARRKGKSQEPAMYAIKAKILDEKIRYNSMD